MVKPKALRSGSHIRIVSPASAVTEQKISAGVALLEAEGYTVSLANHVYDRDGYLAGSDADRASDLTAAFSDPDVDCVMCSRGGYGTARLLPLLDLAAIAASGKMFCGFSDVTTLHLALNRRGLVTFHTPMPLTFSVERVPWVYESFSRLLKGDATVPTEAPHGETLVSGFAEGVLTGGCMCLLSDSLATDDAFDPRGKIVLLEDVDEDARRVDAMLTHFINAGLLQKASGIVIGEMTNSEEKTEDAANVWPWRKIVEDRVTPLGVPTIVGYPIGHMKAMLSVPLGVVARLDAEAGTLVVTEPPCS